MRGPVRPDVCEALLLLGLPAGANAADRIKAVASFSILGDMVRQVGGDVERMEESAHSREEVVLLAREAAADGEDAVLLAGLGHDYISEHPPLLVADQGIVGGPEDAGQGRDAAAGQVAGHQVLEVDGVDEVAVVHDEVIGGLEDVPGIVEAAAGAQDLAAGGQNAQARAGAPQVGHAGLVAAGKDQDALHAGALGASIAAAARCACTRAR